MWDALMIRGKKVNSKPNESLTFLHVSLPCTHDPASG